jgi:hypothetical protein
MEKKIKLTENEIKSLIIVSKEYIKAIDRSPVDDTTTMAKELLLSCSSKLEKAESEIGKKKKFILF